MPLAPWLALGGRDCPRACDDSGTEAVVRHSNDLAKLKKTYEQHAEECAQVAELTVDLGRREVYLNLAREWTEAAAALQTQTQ